MWRFVSPAVCSVGCLNVAHGMFVLLQFAACRLSRWSSTPSRLTRDACGRARGDGSTRTCSTVAKTWRYTSWAACFTLVYVVFFVPRDSFPHETTLSGFFWVSRKPDRISWTSWAAYFTLVYVVFFVPRSSFTHETTLSGYSLATRKSDRILHWFHVDDRLLWDLGGTLLEHRTLCASLVVHRDSSIHKTICAFFSSRRQLKRTQFERYWRWFYETWKEHVLEQAKWPPTRHNVYFNIYFSIADSESAEQSFPSESSQTSSACAIGCVRCLGSLASLLGYQTRRHRIQEVDLLGSLQRSQRKGFPGQWQVSI